MKPLVNLKENKAREKEREIRMLLKKSYRTFEVSLGIEYLKREKFEDGYINHYK